MRRQRVTPAIEHDPATRRWTSTIAFVLCFCSSTAATAGAQPLSFSADHYPTAIGARAIASGDFDRNGWPDVAQANTGANSVTVLLNRAGSLTRSADIPVGAGPFAVTTGDFNRDGVLDLAVACADGNSVACSSGAGMDVPADRHSRNRRRRQSACRPLRGRERGRTARPDRTGYESNSVQIWLGSGTGSSQEVRHGPGFAVHPQGIGLADFNHDGRADIVVAYDGPTGLAVLYGTASGFAAPAAVSGAQNLNVVATADLNSDGWMDVAAASTTNGRVAVYSGGCERSDVQGVVPNRALAPRLAIGDVNQDGALDVRRRTTARAP